MASQTGWRWCIKCRGIFFAGHASKGRCPALGEHQAANEIKLKLLFSPPKISIAQDNWRFCNKCKGLFFHGNVNDGACPATGFHDPAGSGDYQILFTGGPVTIPHLKVLGLFLWCFQCEGMWLQVGDKGKSDPLFAGLKSLGVCPRGGFHASQGSGRYQIQTG